MKTELAEFLNKRKLYDQELKNRSNDKIYLTKIMQDYADQEVKNLNIANVSDCSHPREHREYIGNNMLRCKKCDYEFK
jgi:hypothetical protein